VESLGQKLQETREGKGLSLEQVATDTKLAMRYLEALEVENFSSFPGEPYITGFIRNYGGYLGLEVEDLLDMYRAIKIQEQPIPVEQLLRKPSIIPKVALIAASALVFVAIVTGIFLLLTSRRQVETAAPNLPERLPIEYVMDDDNFEHRLFAGDSVLVFFPLSTGETVQQRIRLVGIEDNEVVIDAPGERVLVALSRHANVDFDGTGSPDLRIDAMEFERNNVSMGVQLRLERYTASSFIPEIEVVPTGAASVTAQSQSTVIFTSPTPYPFTFQANFLAGNMFRYEVLAEPNRRDRNERFFQRLDELTVPQLNNGIRIWTSNAQAGRFQVIGGGRTVPVEIGTPGEVVVADIRWFRGEDNVFRLMVVRLET